MRQIPGTYSISASFVALPVAVGLRLEKLEANKVRLFPTLTRNKNGQALISFHSLLSRTVIGKMLGHSCPR